MASFLNATFQSIYDIISPRISKSPLEPEEEKKNRPPSLDAVPVGGNGVEKESRGRLDEEGFVVSLGVKAVQVGTDATGMIERVQDNSKQYRLGVAGPESGPAREQRVVVITLAGNSL